METIMCCKNHENTLSPRARNACYDRTCHHTPGFLSKKKQVQALETQLASMKEQVEDLEEYISELKSE